MGMDEEAVAAPAATPAGHEVGCDVSELSETDIEQRMTLLVAEIERLRLALRSKRASRVAADAFFKR